MSKRALDRRTCEHHGPASLYRNSVCVSCEREFGVSATTRVKRPVESLPDWMKKTILGVGNSTSQAPSRRSSGVRGHELTKIELSVFRSLGLGLRPIEISNQLGVSFAAVSNTIGRLADKHCVATREQLKALARKAVATC